MKEHPYQVSESGYAGFNLQIEVYFKNKEEPKKVTYTYDLFLLGDKPTSYFRIEQLTFLNPTEDFRRRLIKAGGVSKPSLFFIAWFSDCFALYIIVYYGEREREILLLASNLQFLCWPSPIRLLGSCQVGS